MAADEMYFYLDDTAQQKGPLPRRALLKLLESGLVSRATYVWRHGADAGATAWEQIHAYEPLAATAEMVQGQWYIAGLGDAGEGAGGGGEGGGGGGALRAGPYNLRELRRRFDAGEIDGLTSVWCGRLARWTPLATLAYAYAVASALMASIQLSAILTTLQLLWCVQPFQVCV